MNFKTISIILILASVILAILTATVTLINELDIGYINIFNAIFYDFLRPIFTVAGILAFIKFIFLK